MDDVSSRIHVLRLNCLAYFNSDGSFARCFMYESPYTLIEEHSRAVAAGHVCLTFSQTFYLLPNHPLYNHKDCYPLGSGNGVLKLKK